MNPDEVIEALKSLINETNDKLKKIEYQSILDDYIMVNNRVKNNISSINKIINNDKNKLLKPLNN